MLVAWFWRRVTMRVRDDKAHGGNKHRTLQMGQATGIEWCDHTYNPGMGCTKVSPACDHCYAEAQEDARMGV
jgi:hypothetical protein